MTHLTSARETVIARLCEDLTGPRKPDEILDSRPSDVYLTGILWPRKTDVTPEEDNGYPSLQVAKTVAMMLRIRGRLSPWQCAGRQRQASRSPPVPDSGSARVRVRVRFGMYHHVEAEKSRRWQRKALEPDTLAMSLSRDRRTIPQSPAL